MSPYVKNLVHTQNTTVGERGGGGGGGGGGGTSRKRNEGIEKRKMAVAERVRGKRRERREEKER